MPDTTTIGGTPNLPPSQFLTHFNAEPIEGGVRLHWTTSAQYDLERFIIERSTDGSQFDPVQEIASSGYEQQPTSYSYKDSPPSEGTYIYRLKLVQQGGLEEVGPMVAADIRHRHRKLLVYPNPAREQLNLAIDQSEEELHFVLFDRKGRVLREGPLTSNRSALDIAELPAGLHGVAVMNLHGEVRSSSNWVKE